MKNVDEATDAVSQIKQVKRSFCREWAESKFSSKKMAEDYFELYKRILGLK